LSATPGLELIVRHHAKELSNKAKKRQKKRTKRKTQSNTEEAKSGCSMTIED